MRRRQTFCFFRIKQTSKELEEGRRKEVGKGASKIQNGEREQLRGNRWDIGKMKETMETRSGRNEEKETGEKWDWRG